MERANYPWRGLAPRPPRVGRNVLLCIDDVREFDALLKRRTRSFRQKLADLLAPSQALQAIFAARQDEGAVRPLATGSSATA